MDNFELQQAELILKLMSELVGYAQGKNIAYKLQFQQLISSYQGGVIQQSNQSGISNTLQPQGGDENMKYITKRNDGRWCGRKSINGKRICVYGKTQKECFEKLKKLSNRKQQVHGKSFYDFSIWWLETYKSNSVSEKTYKDYFYNIKRYLKVSTPINKITLLQLQELLNKLPPTRTKEELYTLIKQIVKKAYELDFVHKDIAQFLVKGKIQKGEKRALNVEEQRKLMNQLSDDLFSKRVLFYLCTGCRPSEIKTVNLKELKPGYVKINGTKTATSVRWVKISEKLYQILKNETQAFFSFDDKKFREHLKRSCEKAGIEYNVDTYTLRHTYATNLYIIGIPEKDRQTYLGHKDGSKVTNDVYTTFSPDVKAKDIYDIYGEMLPIF